MLHRLGLLLGVSLLGLACTPPPATGAPCNSDSECASGEFCVDGLCQRLSVDPPPARVDSGPGGVVDSGQRSDSGTDVDGGGDSIDGGGPTADGGDPGVDAGSPPSDDGGPAGDGGDPGVDAGVIDADAGPPAEGCVPLSFDGHLYYSCSTAAAWSVAQASCQGVGMELMAIHSLEERTFSQGIWADLSDFWIGLNDDGREGIFEWSDGSDLLYEHFENGQPNGVGAQNCVDVGWADGHWEDAPCDEAKPYVCEAAQPPVTSQTPYCERQPDLCPCEARVFGGDVYAFCNAVIAGDDSAEFCTSFGLGAPAVGDDADEQAWLAGQDALFAGSPVVCERTPTAGLPGDCTLTNGTYAHCTTTRNYSEARAVCQRAGMDLVIVDDAAELDLLFSISTAQLHVGWNDTVGEGLGRTPQGGVALFAPFTETQPNNSGSNEDCATTYQLPATGERGLRDGTCSSDRAFVCEEPPNVAPPVFTGDLCRDFPDACPCKLYTSGATTFGVCPNQIDAREHEAFCARIGMEQATPETQLDGDRLLALAREQLEPISLAIGMRAADGASWTWLNSDTPNYYLWDTAWNQPNNSGEGCVGLYERGGMLWHDIDCTNDVPTACEMPAQRAAGCVDDDGDGYGTGCALGDDCDDTAWHINPGRFDVCDGIDNDCSTIADDDPVRCACVDETVATAGGADFTFQLCDEDVPYDTAVNRCLAMGSALAVVEDQEVNDLLVTAVQTEGLATPWIGASDRITEGTMVWTDGSDVLIDVWALGEPNDTGGLEDCVTLTHPSRVPPDDGWNDLACTTKNNYVCGPL